MKIEIAVLVKIGMDSHSHIVADTEYRPERVGTRTQVRNGTEVLHTEPFLLQRIFLGVGCAVDLKTGELYLHRLPCTLALYERTRSRDTSTSCNGLELLFGELAQVGYNLNVLDSGTVVKGDKRYILVATTASDPTADVDFCAEVGALERINDYCSLH